MNRIIQPIHAAYADNGNIGGGTWAREGAAGAPACPARSGWVGRRGLSCVSDDCTATYANAVDAAPSGIYVTGNFGIAGVQGSDNFALSTPPAGG